MRSRLAEQAQKELIEMARRLSPEARLEAFAEHSRLLFELYEAGKRHRDQKQKPKP